MLDRFAFRKKAVKKGVHSAVCVECNRGGYTEWTLRMHLRDAHKYIACKACRQIFASDAEHRCPLQNIACDRCPKRFAKPSNLQDHKKIHFEATYECVDCKKKFKQKQSYLEHRKRHLPPTLECEFCQQKFAIPKDLKIHREGNKHHRIGCKVVQQLAKENS